MKVINVIRYVLANSVLMVLDALSVSVPGTEEWSVKYRRY